MLKVSPTYNPNYLAEVVKLPTPRKHSNADRLQCVGINGSNVITGLEAKEGEYYVFFPLECTINKNFLAWSNSFEDKTLNKNPEKKGFFNSKGRVRALKLRGEKSEGYIVPVESLIMWIQDELDPSFNPLIESEFPFDSYNDTIICEKYEIPTKSLPARTRGKNKVRVNKIVDGQFHLHVNTPQLRNNLDRIWLDDTISITYKLHGTSFVVGKTLCNRPLKWYERVLRKIGVKIQETQYEVIYASRKVVKNAYDDYEPAHYYGYDLWSEIAKSLEDKITAGITLYGEAVGYTSNNKPIQPGYDYGCGEGEFATYIYRITMTNADGEVIEYTAKQVKDYCERYGLKTVPELYYGPAYNHSAYHSAFHEDKPILETLSNMYLEKRCYMCHNDVPAEGIVIRKEGVGIEVYKYKSFAFLQRETDMLDKEIVGVEE